MEAQKEADGVVNLQYRKKVGVVGRWRENPGWVTLNVLFNFLT